MTVGVGRRSPLPLSQAGGIRGKKHVGVGICCMFHPKYDLRTLFTGFFLSILDGHILQGSAAYFFGLFRANNTPLNPA